MFTHLAFLRKRIRPPVQTIIWLSCYCLLVFGLIFSVEESRLRIEKGPSHHFSVNTNGILLESAGRVKIKKSYNNYFFSKRLHPINPCTEPVKTAPITIKDYRDSFGDTAVRRPLRDLRRRLPPSRIIYFAIKTKSTNQYSLNLLIHSGQSPGRTLPALVQRLCVLNSLCHFRVHNSLSPTFLTDQSINRTFTSPLCRLIQ